MRISLVCVVLLGALVLTPTSWASDFPLRSEYADVPWISTNDLAADFGKTPIIDVRSAVEFEVIHIKGAINNPIARSTFDSNLAEISGHDKSAKLIFYCNGHTCAKSYKAVRRAVALGYGPALAYDAGVFDWTNAHPDKAVLLGETPVDRTRLIPEQEFRRRLLGAKAFIEGAQDASSILIDVREPMQRAQTPDFGSTQPAKLYMIELASRLRGRDFRKNTQGKTLYVFDAAGKQVRWLQYHLEQQGYDDYYFLENGVWSVFGAAGASHGGGGAASPRKAD